MKNDVKVIIQYLTILELPLDKPISKEIVKAQYHKLAKIYHPDGHQDVYTDGERFKLLHEAYDYCINNIDYINDLISKDFSQNNTNQKTNNHFDGNKENIRFDKSDFVGFVNAVQTSLSVFGLPIDKKINLSELNKLYGIIYLQVRNNREVYSAIKSAYEFLSSNIDLANNVIASGYDFYTFNVNLEKENARKQAEAEAKVAREKAERERREKEAEEHRKAQEEMLRRQKELQAKKEKEKRESKELFLKKIEEHKNKTDFSLFSQKNQEKISALYLKYKAQTDYISTFDEVNAYFEHFIQEYNSIPTLRKEKTRKRIFIYSFVSLFCVLAVVSGIIGGIQIYKNNRYKQAISLIESGDYSSALQLLDSLNGYKESDKISIVARSLSKLNENSKEDDISSTIESLSSLLNYSDINYHSKTYTIASNSNDYTSRFLNGDFAFYYPPTNSGYDVGSWRYNVASYHHSTNSCDFYLDANWVPHSYSITYDLDGGINNLKNPSIFNCEQSEISLLDPSKEGYTFSGWFDSKSGGSKISVIDTNIKQDVKLYARWNINYYTVTFKNWDGTILEEKQVEYNSNVVYSGETPSRNDENYIYTWSGWDKSTSNVKSDLILTATFDSYSKGLSFVFSGSSYAVSSYSGTTTKIIIPNEYDGYSVKFIMENVFQNCTDIQEVILPSSIQSIGNYAFAGCSSLSSIVLPSSLESIGEYCFSNCSALSNINIPKSITTLPSGLFSGCVSINSFTIPSHVSTIGNYCFANTSISSISIPDTVSNIGSYAFSGLPISSLAIPNKTILSDSALGGLSNLSTLTLPIAGYDYSRNDYDNNRIYMYHYPLGYLFGTTGDDLKYNTVSQKNYIYWFRGFDTQQDLSTYSNYKIPKTLKNITVTSKTEPYSFSGITSLESVSFGSEVTSISQRCFLNCSALKTVSCPNTMQYIYEYAFANCVSLSSFVVPSSVVTIHTHAFESCTSLSSIRIPISVSYVGSCAFMYDTGLTIFCEASSKPYKWESDWNVSNCTVIWNA